MKRASVIAVLFFLASCGREVPLRIGPTSLIHDFSELEVRVWRDAACPSSASDAASIDHPSDVLVERDYTGVAGAAAVGTVPSGAHAVTALARDSACNVAAYGCTASVDFASASSVDITWTSVTTPIGCPSGESCVSGRCTSSTADAGH